MGRTRFAEVMAGDPDALMLDEASLLVSARLQPHLDLIEWLAALDMLAGECPTPTADGVARHLFDAEHFAGNRRDYYDWRNSCLDRVIATRLGIPITLAIVMIEVARRVGVRLVPVGMPMHFLVGVAGDEDTFYDPFEEGRRLHRGDARRIFEQMSAGRLAWEESHLEATANRDVVIRVLNNLRGVLTARRDVVRLGIVMGLRGEIAEVADAEAAEIAAATSVFN